MRFAKDKDKDMYPVCLSPFSSASQSESDLRAYTARVSAEINGLAPATVYPTGFGWQLSESTGACHSPVIFWDVVCTMHMHATRTLERAHAEPDSVRAAGMYKQAAAVFACIASNILPMWSPAARVVAVVASRQAPPVAEIPPWLTSETWDALARVAWAQAHERAMRFYAQKMFMTDPEQVAPQGPGGHKDRVFAKPGAAERCETLARTIVCLLNGISQQAVFFGGKEAVRSVAEIREIGITNMLFFHAMASIDAEGRKPPSPRALVALRMAAQTPTLIYHPDHAAFRAQVTRANDLVHNVYISPEDADEQKLLSDLSQASLPRKSPYENADAESTCDSLFGVAFALQNSHFFAPDAQ
jgi:hypothetical protein